MKQLGYKIQNKIQSELNYIVGNNDMTESYLKDRLEKAIEYINDGNFTLYVSFDKLLATSDNNGTIYLRINIEQNEPQEYLTISSEIIIPKNEFVEPTHLVRLNLKDVLSQNNGVFIGMKSNSKPLFTEFNEYKIENLKERAKSAMKSKKYRKAYRLLGRAKKLQKQFR